VGALAFFREAASARPDRGRRQIDGRSAGLSGRGTAASEGSSAPSSAGERLTPCRRNDASIDSARVRRVVSTLEIFPGGSVDPREQLIVPGASSARRLPMLCDIARSSGGELRAEKPAQLIRSFRPRAPDARRPGRARWSSMTVLALGTARPERSLEAHEAGRTVAR